MVPRACNKRFLKIVFELAEIFNISEHAQHAMKSVLVCSACDEIHSAYAQCVIKFVPRMLSIDCTYKTVHILPLAEHARKFVPRMLSVR
jgi:hypothetical protein